MPPRRLESSFLSLRKSVFPGTSWRIRIFPTDNSGVYPTTFFPPICREFGNNNDGEFKGLLAGKSQLIDHLKAIGIPYLRVCT